MTAFEPGEGWREVDSLGYDLADVDSDGIHYRLDGVDRFWVREEPVTELPTALYTVIRVQWRVGRDAVLTLTESGWLVAANITNYRTPAQVVEDITGFEVLAEPVALTGTAVQLDTAERFRIEDRVRRETAKTVLDRVRDYNEGHAAWIAERLYPEFGVES